MTTMAPDADGDDDFGSFDDGFGSFEDADASGTTPGIADANNDQPAHDVLEEASAPAPSPIAPTPDAAVEDGGSLPPPDSSIPPVDGDTPIPALPEASNNEDIGGSSEVGNEPASSTNDGGTSELAEHEQQPMSDTPLSAPSPSPSPPPAEIPTVEEAMESADETAASPNASIAAPPLESSSFSHSADVPAVTTGSGSGGMATMMSSPPPLGAETANNNGNDHNDDDPFASLGGSTDAPLPVLGDFGGFASGVGGGDYVPAAANAAAPLPTDTDAEAPNVTTETTLMSGVDINDNQKEGAGADVIQAETEALAAPIPDGDADLHGAIPSEEPTMADTTATSNPPMLDQLSSFVTAATEDVEEVSNSSNGVAAPSSTDDQENNDNDNDDDDEDDFGGFEDAASEEEEKKDGSPMADKAVPAVSNAPPVLPLETENMAAADSFGDEKADVVEAGSSEANGDQPEIAVASTLDAFGGLSAPPAPAPVSEASAVEDDGGDVFGGFNDPTKPEEPLATATTETPVSQKGEDGETLFDAFAQATAPVKETTPALTEEEDYPTAGVTQAAGIGESGPEITAVDEANDAAAASDDAAVKADDKKVAESAEVPVFEPDIVESYGGTNEFDAFAGAPTSTDIDVAPLAEPEETQKPADDGDSDDGFDAFAEASPAPPVEVPAPAPSHDEPHETEKPAEDYNSDDGFDAFAEASPSVPAETEQPTEETDSDDGFDAFAEAAPAVPSHDEPKETEKPVDDDDSNDGFDAFAEASPAGPAEAPAEAPAPVSSRDEEANEVDECDEDFGDFGDFGVANEAEDAPPTAEVNDIAGDTNVESKAPEETPSASPVKDDDDDGDDDFGDFGEFDEAPMAEPAAESAPAPAPAPSKAEATPGTQDFAASFGEQPAPSSNPPSKEAASDPIIHRASIVCRGMFRQYASSSLPEGEETNDNGTERSIPVKSILDSVLASSEDSGPAKQPSSSMSSKEQLQNIFSGTEIERGPTALIMNYGMPNPYAQYSADAGADLKTDRGLSLEASSHSRDGDVFVPEVLSIDLPTESEMSPEPPRASKTQVEASAEFVDFPMSATRVEIPDKKDGSNGGGFANFGDSSATTAAKPTSTAVASADQQEPAQSAVDKFLAKIPDLSFMLSKELVLPK